LRSADRSFRLSELELEFRDRKVVGLLPKDEQRKQECDGDGGATEDLQKW
jgi:hypothetical protein